jgi:hypothetical protein
MVPVRVVVLLAVTMLASFAYFYEGGGWNQNTRLDLVRAIVEHDTVTIDRYAANTGDAARFEGHTYADKAPGQPLLAVVPVAIARPILSAVHVAPDSEMGTSILAYVATLTTSSVPAVLAAIAVFFLAIALDASVAGASFAALSFGLASPMWAYATLFWGHALATMAILGGFAAAVALPRARRPRLVAAAVGFAGALAFIVDYSVAPAVAIVVALAVVRAGRADARRMLLSIAAGAAVPLAALLAYNAWSFESPFHLGYGSEVAFPRLHEGVMGFTYPRPAILFDVLLGRARGLFIVAPQLVLAPAGLVLLARRRSTRTVALAAAAIVVAVVLTNASYTYWSGGWSYGPRFLAPALPFLCLGLAPLWDRAGAALRGTAIALAGVAAALAFGAVATTPQIPTADTSPVAVTLPAVRDGNVALGAQSYLDLQPEHPPSATTPGDDASNVGLLLGLRGLWSLLPLVGVWTAAGAVAWRWRAVVTDRGGR